MIAASATRRMALLRALSLAASIVPLRVARAGPSAATGANDNASQPPSQPVEAALGSGRKDDAVFFFY